ncbi:MAG: hypothetical protein D3910_22485 [Candidatus Electrothrix sp. ATG2]|nr:hypothetical protein [Candidatus Electrothrix sp. ATG2]
MNRQRVDKSKNIKINVINPANVSINSNEPGKKTAFSYFAKYVSDLSINILGALITAAILGGGLFVIYKNW